MRSKSVLIRLTPDEKDEICEAAMNAGLSVGAYLRAQGLREAAAQRARVRATVAERAAALADMSAIEDKMRNAVDLAVSPE